ncbi:MAG TPA: EAL domain-containing protein [Clostridiaceae bacterium]|nr:EAL domain-containing protein [Clostridiaceae bacterium]
MPKLNAFKFLNKLKECGYNDICVSINVSVVQLLNPDFPGRLLELINNMQVNPDNVCIEITESVFASDMETTRCKITRKKEKCKACEE